GLHGVGVSVVNALSIDCQAYIFKEGSVHFQQYSKGIPKGPVEVINTTDKTGTMIRFIPDDEIFETTTFSFEILSQRLRELAFLNKGISITITDNRIPTPKQHVFRFDGGVREFVQYLNKNKTVVHKEPIYFEVEREGVIAEIAIEYNDGYTESMFSYVNNINTREGGTHLVGFKSALTRTLNEFLK